MPEGARILRFPDRQSASALSEDANERALAYLATSFDGRPIEDTKALLSDSDSILAFCQILRARCDSIPNEIAREAVFAHGLVDFVGPIAAAIRGIVEGSQAKEGI